MDTNETIDNSIKIKNKNLLRVNNLKIDDVIQFDNDKINYCDKLKVVEILDSYIIFINVKKFTRKLILKKALIKANWHIVMWYEPIWFFYKNISNFFLCAIFFRTNI